MNNTRLVCKCFVLFCLVFFLGCQRKPKSYGEGLQIFVVADAPTWEALQAPLRAVFEHSYFTPREEILFRLNWTPPEKFSEVAIRKNLLLVGLLGAEGEISGKVENMLSAAVKSRVEEGTAFVFPKEDPWSKGQHLLVLAGNSPEQLSAKLKNNANYLYSIFYERLRAATADKMFKKLEQKDVSEELLEKYGWTIRVQHDYFINIQRQDENFLMIRRSLSGRERWLFVNWIENGDSSLIDENWLIARRNAMTKKFYQGDVAYENEHNNYRRVTNVEFAGRPALQIEGLWVNDQDLAKGTGGPFRTYSFYDKGSGRIYIIDIAVWFPQGEKEPFLRQLDIMAHSFKTAADLQAEKSKEGS